MRWKRKPNDWHTWFAWLPVQIGSEWIWLERYERIFKGEFYLVRALPHPAERDAILEGNGE